MSDPRPEREQRIWVVAASLAIVLVLGGILNLARVALFSSAVTLPAHLAPWATRAANVEQLIREEASIRMLEDPEFQDMRWAGESDKAEALFLERYSAEVRGEVELIQRIVSLSARLASEGAAPSEARQREVLSVHLAAARRGTLLPDEALEDQLAGIAPISSG